jgi:hypothetical protein
MGKGKKKSYKIEPVPKLVAYLKGRCHVSFRALKAFFRMSWR